MKPTFWNSWGPLALFKRISGKPIPGDKYSPTGYVSLELGPKIAQNKKNEEHETAVEQLMTQVRGGCPFGFS
jgi:hypothetical protein